MTDLDELERLAKERIRAREGGWTGFASWPPATLTPDVVLELIAEVRKLKALVDNMDENATMAFVDIRQECARIAHQKSGDINVGHEVGLLDLLPFVKSLSARGKDGE